MRFLSLLCCMFRDRMHPKCDLDDGLISLVFTHAVELRNKGQSPPYEVAGEAMSKHEPSRVQAPVQGVKVSE